MLRPEENELLTRTGRGTPMGDLLRRYWLPALCSWELPEPDGPPLRLKLLGEQLIAFRDSSGRVGLLDEFCPHRGASLFLGRNEDCGLRCVYHGWKFDVDGNCVDQMNEPESFAGKIQITAYPAVELGGVVWAYMGPKETPPPPPNFAWTRVPETHRAVTRTWEECNWLQALEGGVDTSHVPVLHRLLAASLDGDGYAPSSPFVRSGASTVEVAITDYGFRYAGIRPLGDEGQYVRAYHFVMPCTQIRPQQLRSAGGYKPHIAGHCWVPMDDQNCMVWNWVYSFGDAAPGEMEQPLREEGNTLDYLDATNNFRKVLNRDKQWLLDRRAQKTQSFTGIKGINTQDHAVQESMGPILDRSREHLGPADKPIIALRQVLQRALRIAEDGGDPPGLAPSYYHLRAIEQTLPYGVHWWDAMKDEIDPQAQPAR